VTGQAHFIDLIPFIVGGVVLGWLAWREAVVRRQYRIEFKRFICPTLRRKIDAEIVRDAESGVAIGVKSCSAFTDPETVACDKECVREPGPLTPVPLKPAPTAAR